MCVCRLLRLNLVCLIRADWRKLLKTLFSSTAAPAHLWAQKQISSVCNVIWHILLVASVGCSMRNNSISQETFSWFSVRSEQFLILFWKRFFCMHFMHLLSSMMRAAEPCQPLYHCMGKSRTGHLTCIHFFFFSIGWIEWLHRRKGQRLLLCMRLHPPLQGEPLTFDRKCVIFTACLTWALEGRDTNRLCGHPPNVVTAQKRFEKQSHFLLWLPMQ